MAASNRWTPAGEGTTVIGISGRSITSASSDCSAS